MGEVDTKTIIAGSRNGCNPLEFEKALLASGFNITEVVCGCASGIDSQGFLFACFADIPVKHFPAQWDMYRKGAGPIRNGLMADYGEQLIAFLEPDSVGTADMIKQARAKRLITYVHPLEAIRKPWRLTHKQIEEDYGFKVL